MSKLMKILVGIVGVLLLVFLGAGFYLSRNLPHFVKEAVETYAPKTTGTPVKLDAVGFNYMTGTVTLKHFVVGNPVGYSTDHAFQFDALKFRLDLSTVFKKVIVIREFRIDGANIIAEQQGSLTHTNLQDIADHAKSVSPPEEPASAKSKKHQPKLILDKLAFTDNTVDLVSESFGSRKIKMPDIVINDIGKKEGGLTPDQMTQRITQLVTEQVSNAVKDELKQMAIEKGKDTLMDKVKGWFGK